MGLGKFFSSSQNPRLAPISNPTIMSTLECWRQLPPAPEGMARAGHSAVVTGSAESEADVDPDCQLVFGGEDADGRPTNSLLL